MPGILVTNMLDQRFQEKFYKDLAFEESLNEHIQLNFDKFRDKNNS